MPFYIATVWKYAVTEGEYDDLTRQVVRAWAEDERAFKAAIQDNVTRHVDDQVWFGPIGLSRDQRTPA